MEYTDNMLGLAFVQFSSKKKCKESIGGTGGVSEFGRYCLEYEGC